MNGIMEAGLAERGDGGQCNMPRIPTGRYPAWAKSYRVTFDANGEAIIEVKGERDLLLTTLSTQPNTDFWIDGSYCNTKYLVQSSARVWQLCCDRKPVFLVGIRENKTLRLRLYGGTPAAETVVTVAGFQGNGCCG